MTLELSVVVPVHNEIDNIGPLTGEIHAALTGTVEYEVLFVDDGSTDGTSDHLVRLAAADARVRLVRHPARAGQSAATVSGVTAAQAPWVATLDGDGQNDPADIPRLLAALRAWSVPRPGLIVGHRVQRRDSRLKRLSSRVANGVRARVLRDATPDTACGLKLFRRDAFLAVPRFDHMHRFLPALFQRDGWAVQSVPVAHRPRRGGRSHYGMWDRLRVGIVDMLGVWWLSRRTIGPTDRGA